MLRKSMLGRTELIKNFFREVKDYLKDKGGNNHALFSFCGKGK